MIRPPAGGSDDLCAENGSVGFQRNDLDKSRRLAGDNGLVQMREGETGNVNRLSWWKRGPGRASGPTLATSGSV